MVISPELFPNVLALINRCQETITAARLEGDTEPDEAQIRIECGSEIENDDLLANLVAETREALVDAVMDELYRLGPIEPFLHDPEVTEIVVNAYDKIYTERNGVFRREDAMFFDEAHIIRIIDRITTADNRRCDESSPLCDCSLHRPGASFDGSRVNCGLRPVAVDSAYIDIRKFRNDALTVDQLIAGGAFDRRMAAFLEALVVGRMNIIVMGGTGSGKTTLLNCLSDFLPRGQRIVTIEDTAELHLSGEHVLRMESRQANAEGKGEITIQKLVKNALRQRPDRIVVGECRGAEAFDMVQAMGTGHDGSLTTLHANDPRGAIDRMQSMIQMAGFDMPDKAIRALIAGSVDFIVHIKRYMDGSRRIAEISEICGMEGDVVTMEPIFVFEQEATAPGEKVRGRFVATGGRPSAKHADRIRAQGVDIDQDWFSNMAWDDEDDDEEEYEF